MENTTIPVVGFISKPRIGMRFTYGSQRCELHSISDEKTHKLIERVSVNQAIKLNNQPLRSADYLCNALNALQPTEKAVLVRMAVKSR